MNAAPVEGTAAGIRQILARVTGREELLDIPADLPLFGDGAGLDSLTGTLLLREIQRWYGVDVAAEDLNLDALATLRTLTDFVAARTGARSGGNTADDGQTEVGA